MFLFRYSIYSLPNKRLYVALIKDHNIHTVWNTSKIRINHETGGKVTERSLILQAILMYYNCII